MQQRVIGLLMILLPMGGWLWDLHHDPCGPQGEAWQQCWAHHQGEHGAVHGDAPVSLPGRDE